MKHVLLSILTFCCLGISGFGQISLDVNDYHRYDNAYYRGFRFTNLSGIQLTPPGPDQTWDFFFLEQDIADTLRIVKADITPYYDDFPGSELALTSNEQSYYYESLEPEGVRINGSVIYNPIISDVVVTPFQFTGSALPYPINFGDSYTFSYEYNSINPVNLPLQDSSRTHSMVDASITVDAWGQLTIPCGTFPVLRFRQMAYTLDSNFVYSTAASDWILSSVYRDTMLTDLFYTNNIGSSLLTINAYPNQIIRSVNFLRGFLINGTTNATQAAFRVFPQPAQEALQIETHAGLHMQLSDIQGRILRTFEAAPGVQSIPRDGLPAGMYLLRAQDAQGRFMGSRKVMFGPEP